MCFINYETPVATVIIKRLLLPILNKKTQFNSFFYIPQSSPCRNLSKLYFQDYLMNQMQAASYLKAVYTYHTLISSK